MSLESAFDDTDRPSGKIIQDCVHCGFCLSSCPTYLETGNELDSPRGRIHLIKAAEEGRIPMGTSLVKHLDLCLGCLACETACPSGVKYGSLIEMSRGQIERRFKRGFGEKMLRAFIFSVFPYPRRLRFLLPFVYLVKALGLKRVFPSALLNRISLSGSSMFHMLPEISSAFGETLAASYPAVGERKKRVALLSGCVQGVFFPEINRATVEVLCASGCEVFVPQNQGCCGALSVHSGRLEEGRGFARKLVDLFDAVDVDAIVVNSAGCGSTMKEYVELLREDPVYFDAAARLSAKTVDLMEFLSDTGIGARLHPLDIKVTYQDACHIVHGQGIRSAPRELLASVPGLRFTEMLRSDHCCGSAGIYNIVQPEMSSRLLSGKIREIEKTGADYLAVGNPGCMIQIRRGLLGSDSRTKVIHPVEILNWSLKGGIS
ncbi:MAG: 4Fe-4S dicluster domain-containing protein [Candidatus Dadabacteria bacterium]|nr:4Fe-4S dicluster domain-containing protein [Candidatus Dadabacteria bacterium]MYC39560.1 4Fe-4S dicluster domain-containing protein [Candidatus Dadabacteria bacterium]